MIRLTLQNSINLQKIIYKFYKLKQIEWECEKPKLTKNQPIQ